MCRPRGQPVVQLPRTSIRAEELAILVNDDDPQSVAVAAYYQQVRKIPEANVIHLNAPVNTNTWARDSFMTAKAAVDGATPDTIQAYVVTWTRPYRVDCMSLVSAFALGFDTKYCKQGTQTCGTTAAVPYFNSTSTRPWQDFGIRPTMMLAAATVDQAKALVDRGPRADGTFFHGDGYLVRTTDSARSVRWNDFTSMPSTWNRVDGIQLYYIDNVNDPNNLVENTIRNKTNVLLYLTGLASVADIATNTYLPGAVADHLTSYGGQVPTSGQMSVVKWLEAGATASFGTVVEPCNYPSKFPQASVLLSKYFGGATVLEAYWKSVMTPGEGNFVGEPLARPWGTRVEVANETLTLTTTILRPGVRYELREADAEGGPYRVVISRITVPQQRFEVITYSPARAQYYALVCADTGGACD